MMRRHTAGFADAPFMLLAAAISPFDATLAATRFMPLRYYADVFFAAAADAVAASAIFFRLCYAFIIGALLQRRRCR